MHLDEAVSAKEPVMALLQRQSVQYQESHLQDNQTKNLGGFYIVLTVIAAACIFLRLISRSITHLRLARDDWTFVGGSV